LIQGFQGTALGKMASGCRFQPYYPITPASDESVYLESNEILEIMMIDQVLLQLSKQKMKFLQWG